MRIYQNTPLLLSAGYGIIRSEKQSGGRPRETKKRKETKDDDNRGRDDEPHLRVRARVRGDRPVHGGQDGRRGHRRNREIRRRLLRDLGGDDARRAQVEGGQRRQPLRNLLRDGHAGDDGRRPRHPPEGGTRPAAQGREGEQPHGAPRPRRRGGLHRRERQEPRAHLLQAGGADPQGGRNPARPHRTLHAEDRPRFRQQDLRDAQPDDERDQHRVVRNLHAAPLPLREPPLPRAEPQQPLERQAHNRVPLLQRLDPRGRGQDGGSARDPHRPPRQEREGLEREEPPPLQRGEREVRPLPGSAAWKDGRHDGRNANAEANG